MADMKELLDRARALGEAIATHPITKAFGEARHKVDTDPDAKALLDGYRETATRVQQLEAQNKPIEPGDKHKLADFEKQMASNDALKTLMRAQADYLAMMNHVNRAMEAPVAEQASSANADS